MKLQTYGQSYGDFYVPSFVVKVGGQDLVRELYLSVTSVEVDLKEQMMGHFDFTVAGAFDWEAREFLAHKNEERVDLLKLFQFGSSVQIILGYGEPSRLKPVLQGIVTEIGTGFSSGGAPELKISGFDALYPLSTGKTTRPWENVADSDVVRDLVGKSGLSPTIVTTSPKKQRIDQNEQSDLAFIGKLAKGNKGVTYYASGAEFYFGPRRNRLKETVELVWGEGLLSFSPQANLAKQITAVRVFGWSAANGKPIVGNARRGDEQGGKSGGESGAEQLAKAPGAGSTIEVRLAMRTQEEADARAKAILDERAQDYVTGDGECIGLPDIVPDTNVLLQGLGSRFSQKYYVVEATHKLDSSGYRTTFKVQEPKV